jgi:hypothetical protein
VRLVKSIVSCILLGIFLMPSPRILDRARTHKRHATCGHHLRHQHPDPAERAKILRRAERRERRLQEPVRPEQAREDAATVAEALDESNLQPCRAAADPQDDDSRMKRRRRPPRMKTLFWSLQDPPRIRPASDFLVRLRVHLELNGIDPTTETDTLPHYGSGPCHRIPRPREGTVLAQAPCRGVVA